MEVQKANTRKTTNLLKRHFKKDLGIVTSVKTDKYSMGSSLKVKYMLGADVSLVKPIVNQLQYGYFNGMEDIYESVSKEAVVLEGYELEQWKYTGVEQEIPDELLFKFAKAASDNFNIRGVFKLETPDQFHKSFEENWGAAWNWSNILFQNWKVRNFNTQDPDAIQGIKFIRTDDSVNDFVFSYEIDGVEYRTDQYTKPEPNKPNIEKVDVPEGEIQVIEYSEKAIAVIGNTKPIKDTLKALGGRFNFRLSCGAGWIFPKSKMEELKQALS